MIKRILTIIIAILISSESVLAEGLQVANGTFLQDITPYSDFSEENWTGWQREYFYWGEVEDGRMVLISNDQKTLTPTSQSAMAEGRAVRQRSIPIDEVVSDYSNSYDDHIILIKATLTMPELSDVMGQNDGTYDSSNKKSYAEIAFGAYDPWNPAIITRLVRLVKDNGSETYSVYVNNGDDGRNDVPAHQVKTGISEKVDVIILVKDNNAKYFIDGEYCGQNTFTSNMPSDAYDIGFYCVGGNESDPIMLTVDNAQISVYAVCADAYMGEDDDAISYSFDMDGELVINVSGNMKKEKIGEEVTLSVLSSDMTEIASGESCLGTNGQFEVSATIPQTANLGNYTYKLTLGNGKIINGTFEMPDYSSLNDMLERISNSNSKSEIESVLNSGTNVCSGIEILEQVYPTMDKSFVAEKLFGLVETNQMPTTVAGFVDRVKEYTILSVFNQNIVSYTSDVIDKYASTFGATNECIDYYNNSLNSTGVANVVRNMTGKSFNTYSDAEERFRHLVYTNYITNNNAVGAVNRLAVIENSSYTLGLSFTDTSESVVSALANSQAATPEALMTVYNEATAAPSNPGKKPGTNSGGGGGDDTYVPPIVIPDKVVEAKVYFKDIDNFPWAVEAINFLRENGIVFGKTETNFNPQDNVTREEAISMLMRMFDFKDDTTKANHFKDVSENAWYYKSIKTAMDNNIVSGVSEDSMGIGFNVTRQDFLTMLLRAIITESVVDVYNVQGTAEYTDYESVSDYAKEAVRLFSGLGVVSGYEDGSIKPHNPITRAEAAQIIYKVYKLREGNK